MKENITWSRDRHVVLPPPSLRSLRDCSVFVHCTRLLADVCIIKCLLRLLQIKLPCLHRKHVINPSQGYQIVISNYGDH